MDSVRRQQARNDACVGRLLVLFGVYIDCWPRSCWRRVKHSVDLVLVQRGTHSVVSICCAVCQSHQPSWLRAEYHLGLWLRRQRSVHSRHAAHFNTRRVVHGCHPEATRPRLCAHQQLAPLAQARLWRRGHPHLFVAAGYAGLPHNTSLWSTNLRTAHCCLDGLSALRPTRGGGVLGCSLARLG